MPGKGHLTIVSKLHLGKKFFKLQSTSSTLSHQVALGNYLASLSPVPTIKWGKWHLLSKVIK